MIQPDLLFTTMSRIIARLSAISIQTGVLPLFSWSLATSPMNPTLNSTNHSTPASQERNKRTSPDSNAQATTDGSTNTADVKPSKDCTDNAHYQPREVSFTTATAALDTHMQDLRQFVSSQVTGGPSRKRKRVLFMGEHHEQPRVLAAQLVILDELVKVARGLGVKQKSGVGNENVEAGFESGRNGGRETGGEDDSADPASDAPPGGKPRVVLVMEQFNILQQGMLDRFCALPDTSTVGSSQQNTMSDTPSDHTSTQRAEERSTTTKSAALAASTSVPSDSQSRITPLSDSPSPTSEQSAASTLLEEYTTPSSIIPSEGFNLPHYLPLLLHARSQGVSIIAGFPPRAWARIIAKDGVDSLKQQHGAVLAESGFDRWEDVRIGERHAAHVRSLMRGEAPKVEDVTGQGKGVLAAQAFKDAVLACVVDRSLGGVGEEIPGDARGGQGDDTIVMVVTGSGHCEYGFGAPERVRECEKDEMSIIVCRSSEESTVWQGPRWGMEREADDQVLADGVIVYEQV